PDQPLREPGRAGDPRDLQADGAVRAPAAGAVLPAGRPVRAGTLENETAPTLATFAAPRGGLPAPSCGRAALTWNSPHALYVRCPPRGLASAFGRPGGADMLSYLEYSATVATILSIATLGLNLQWGVSGQFNAGVVGFVAVGGYSLAILTMPASAGLLVSLAWPFTLGVVGSLLATALVAMLVGLA